MSISQFNRALLPLLLFLFSAPVQAANEYIGSQFTDGNVFSMVVVQEHLLAIPWPNVHAPIATGNIESWLVRWKIGNLTTNQLNPSEQVIYLAKQPRTGEILDGFRASASTNFIICNPANAVELWLIKPQKAAQLSKSLPAEDPATTPPPARLFSRSEKYLFLWKPNPAIYAVSNLSIVKEIKATENFKKFEADLRKEGGWVEALTDDLKYLVHVPLQFGGPFNQKQMIDTPHCYDFDKDEYTIWKLHAGTNETQIVAAESLDSHLNFIAFWVDAGTKHLGILGRDSQVLAELPTKGTTDTQFWRNSAWDYVNSRFLIREPGARLTIYDYRTKQTQHFSLKLDDLKTP
jgi:hypothetical protein